MQLIGMFFFCLGPMNIQLKEVGGGGGGGGLSTRDWNFTVVFNGVLLRCWRSSRFLARGSPGA